MQNKILRTSFLRVPTCLKNRQHFCDHIFQDPAVSSRPSTCRTAGLVGVSLIRSKFRVVGGSLGPNGSRLAPGNTFSWCTTTSYGTHSVWETPTTSLRRVWRCFKNRQLPEVRNFVVSLKYPPSHTGIGILHDMWDLAGIWPVQKIRNSKFCRFL